MNVDDTKYRVIGDTSYPLGTTGELSVYFYLCSYGKSKIKPYSFTQGENQADWIASKNKFNLVFKANHRRFRKKSKGRKYKIREEASSKTTHKSTFVPKPLDANHVGRLIMRDQNGALVGL